MNKLFSFSKTAKYILVLNFLIYFLSSNSQVIFTSGTNLWTVPACVTSITVQAWGGGGGGGGSTSNQNTSADEACSQGGGGGGGGFVSRVYAVIPGEVYTVVVGAGGVAGLGASTNLSSSAANIITASAVNNGGNGGNSTFSGPATAGPGVLTAIGGTGGGGAWSRNQSNGFTPHVGTDGTAGVGGGGLNATTTFSGGDGSSGRHSASCYDASGAGGGGAGTSAPGGTATSPNSCSVRTGGAAGASDGGAGALGRILNSYSASRQALAGNAGNTLAAGGSGAMIHLHSWPNAWTTAIGGVGARGEVRIYYNAPDPGITSVSATSLTCISTTAQAAITYTNSSAAFNWTGPGIISGANTGTVTVNVSGTYIYTATVSGCITTGTVSIAANTVSPTISSTPAGTLTCTNSVVATSVTSTSTPISFSWSGPGIVSGAATATVNVNQPGTYNYTVTNTANGCKTFSTTTVVQNTITPNVTPSVSNSISCSVNSAQVIASTTSTPVSFIWTGPGITSGANTASATVNAGGNYNYTVTNNTNGCKSVGSVSVIASSFTPTITVSSTQTICPGQSATITATGGSSYTWSPGGATTGTTVVTPAVTTTYSVTSPGCSSPITHTVEVVVNGSIPNIGSVNGPTSVCPNQTVVTYSVNSVGGATYSWLLPTGASITSIPTNSNVITVDFGASSGSVTVVAVTACGSATSVVGVNITPSPTLIMPASMTVCPGQSVTLTMTGAGNYTWAPGSSLSSTTGSVVTANPNVNTTYSVTTLSCGSAITGTVEIAVNGQPPNIGLIDGPTTICTNATTSLSYSVTNVAGTSYTWSVPSGATITSSPVNTNSITINMGTTSGSVIVNAASACGTATSIVSVNISPNPTISATPNQSICPGESVILTAGGAATFTWMPGNITTQTISVSPTVTTIYTVTGNNGICSSTNTVQVSAVANPTLIISSNATVCPGSANTFTVGGATNYTWTPNVFLNNNNSSTVISTPTASVTYTVNGTTGACATTETLSISVQNTVVVNAAATTLTICPLKTTTITASGATNYTWSPAITLNTNIGAMVVASPAFATTYTVIGATGTCTNSAEVIITTAANPILAATNSTICSGSTVALNVSGANTYTWVANPSLSATGISNPIANPNNTSSYSVSGTSALGCIGSTVVTVNVVQAPTLTISTAPNSTTICAGESITLSSFGASSYDWSPAASLNTANGSPVTATPNQTTIYTVQGTNGSVPNACVNSKTVQITVIPKAVAVTSPRDSICLGNSTTMFANGGNTYSWLPTIGVASPNYSVTNVNPKSTTIYTVTVSTNGLCPGTSTVEIFVNPLPNVYAGQDTIINIDQSITLYGTGSAPVGFTSMDGSVLNCNFCNVITVNPQENTCYVLKGTDSHGCSNSDIVCVTVTKDWNVYIPNAFTPNGDSYNEFFIPVGYGLTQIKLLIFDRWGHEIFRSTEDNVGWDGRSKGTMCEQGVYVYLAEIVTVSGNTINRTGHVTLLPTNVSK